MNFNNIIQQSIKNMLIKLLTLDDKGFIIKFNKKDCNLKNLKYEDINAFYINNQTIIEIIDDNLIISVLDGNILINLNDIRLIFDYKSNILIYINDKNMMYNIVKLNEDVFKNIFNDKNEDILNFINNNEIYYNDFVEQIANKLELYMISSKSSINNLQSSAFQLKIISILSKKDANDIINLIDDEDDYDYDDDISNKKHQKHEKYKHIVYVPSQLDNNII